MNCIFMFTIKILLNLCTLNVDVNTNQKTLRLMKRVSGIKRKVVIFFERVIANEGKSDIPAWRFHIDNMIIIYF